MDFLLDEELEEVYFWIDQIPLSRPKKNISKDFSDGCLMAEVICFYFPDLIDLEDYIPTHRSKVKLMNWSILCEKALRPIGLTVFQKEIGQIVAKEPEKVEGLLLRLKHKMEVLLDEPLGHKPRKKKNRKRKERDSSRSSSSSQESPKEPKKKSKKRQKKPKRDSEALEDISNPSEPEKPKRKSKSKQAKSPKK